jgi:trehalose 6-phosphate synthase
MARQIATALAMSLDERRERWYSMMATLRGSSVQDWFADFLRALADTHHTPIRLPWPVVLDLASRTAQRH